MKRIISFFVVLAMVLTLAIGMASCEVAGEPGPQGAQGLQGEKGDKGDQGEQGLQGEKGDKGDQGEQGLQGEKGDKGDQGAQGLQGEKGDKGDQGAQGLQGEKGDKGDQGAQGLQGEKGEDGVGIQEIEIVNGELIVTYTDESSVNLGPIGNNGSSGGSTGGSTGGGSGNTGNATKHEYVKDGLIAWYDATNNSNGTHDLQADLWKDLSGNANHIDISNAVSAGQVNWSSNALVINDDTGCYLQLSNKVKEALMGNAYTIEIVSGDLNYTATSYITLFASANDELSIMIRCANGDNMKLEYKNQDANGDSNRPFVYDAWNYVTGNTLTITSDLNMLDENGRDNNESTTSTDNVILYSSGVRIASGESELNMDLDYLYLGSTVEHRRWGGEIHSIRIYNRALQPEEVVANAEADQFNYRSGNTFAPTQEYDPLLDRNYVGFDRLEGYVNNRIPFSDSTDLIPTTGFYGSVNLINYLYPYASDIEAGYGWEGARLMKTEEPEIGPDGNPIENVSFDVMYQTFCNRADLTPVTGREAQYVVLKLIVEGEFTDFNINFSGYDADINDTLEFATGSVSGGVDSTLEGEVQYLIYDIADIFDDCESLSRLRCVPEGMTEETYIYLLEMAIFDNELAAYEYAGETYE